MLKKVSVLILVLSLALCSACGKKEEVKESRTVSYEELGLTYTTPDAWREFESKNLHFSAYNMEDIFTVIDYSYITEEDYDKYLQREANSIDGFLMSICKIVVIEAKNSDSKNVNTLFSLYDDVVKAAENDGYEYYVIYNYNGKENFLPEKDTENYKKMVETVPELISSVKAFDFDDTLLAKKTEEAAKMITFITKTLEGEDINSSVFAGYDLTLLNFWGTNAYPKINEHAVLQEVYEWIEQEGLNVNIIMAVTDTPSAENESIALQAKADAGAEFTSIMLDDTLAKWVLNNLNGIPTTVFVNNEAIIISNKTEGVKTADQYKELIIEALKEVK
ncbi:MAG: hypothetical protein E7235_01685 [Lachnospiraceae bacterium]|nr:hypothetical protein [Lachnospiraceae bacterium]